MAAEPLTTYLRQWGAGMLIAVWSLSIVWADARTAEVRFVRVSPRDSHYFELSDGSPYIPVGLNLIAPTVTNDPEKGLAQIESWIRKLSDNQGNFVHIWLSHEFWDIEPNQIGRYETDKAQRIDALLDIARKYNVRVKFTLEHFHSFDPNEWSGKPLVHSSRGGPAESVTDFFTGSESLEQFKRKLDWLAGRYAGEPTIFAWELWNEIDAVKGTGWERWTQRMLAELHRRFSQTLATQSLRSFDRIEARRPYRLICSMAENDIAQVHRYLDPGSALAVCRGPMDVLVSDAVKQLRTYRPAKPILLAESGAVEPNHSGPSALYERDYHGIILHDVLFAPFFSGAAGAGQIWHRDSYVVCNNLWWQFGRFAEAIRGIDPAAEHFEPLQWSNRQVRVYALKGEKTVIAWCRDKNSTWQSELRQQQPPQVLRAVTLNLNRAGVRRAKSINADIYNPWTNRHTTATIEDGRLVLDDFMRSIVVTFRLDDLR